eukprot:TRINITY_DN107207_c0_g1_i1.p3 TRINITY_DN107207_c0_g1~~TRINITY_DN107207_c0_g1_i1.p3  ORF type:complete len:121 (-),score=6.52 TRINITY_DN107207_c0_g1_i1:96-458(-)
MPTGSAVRTPQCNATILPFSVSIDKSILTTRGEPKVVEFQPRKYRGLHRTPCGTICAFDQAMGSGGDESMCAGCSNAVTVNNRRSIAELNGATSCPSLASVSRAPQEAFVTLEIDVITPL